MNMAMNVAAAAGGMAARVATDRAMNWISSQFRTPAQNPYDMRGMQLALPSNAPVARGGARRRRGARRGRRGAGRQGGQPRQGINTRGGATIVVRDTEVIGVVPTTLKGYNMNPGVTETPRLKQYESMYARYRIRYMNVAYKSTSGTATSGSVAVGIMSGPTDPNVKNQDTILKLRPAFVTPAWKTDSLTVGREIDTSKWMMCGDGTSDGIALTIYAMATAAGLGMLQVSYEIEFDQPRPF